MAPLASGTLPLTRELVGGPFTTTIFRAVYEGGVLRPTEPLDLPEGEKVDVFITQTKLSESPLREPTLAETDYARRIHTANSLEEMYAIMATAPLASDGELDIVKELNRSRQLTGFRMMDSDPAEENAS